MNRTGIPTLMGFAPGGAVENEQDVTDTGGIMSTMLDPQDVTQNFALYSGLLNQLAPEPRRLTGYDLASELGRGLLAQQGEKFPSLGRGIGLGFQSFKSLQDEIEEKRRKAKADRDAMAFGLATKSKTSGSAKIGSLWKDDDGNFFRELIVGDQIVYKGEGQVLNQSDFSKLYPNARPTVASEGARYDMKLEDFFKYEKEYKEQEASLDKLQEYFGALGGSAQGFERMAETVINKFKTLFGVLNITPEALNQGIAEGKFQGLIGRFRVETVGPGVMTEFDAERIIKALGGEPGALQNRYRAAAILKTIFESKEKLYSDAAKRYNLGASSGEFEGYEPVEIRTWDKSMFDFPLELLQGQTLIEEVKDSNGEVVAIIYKEAGKTFRRNKDGTVKEIESTDFNVGGLPLPD